MAWVHEVRIPCRLNRPVNMHFVSDFQLGSSQAEKDLVVQKVQEIAADPDAVWGVLGDLEDDDRPTTRIRKKAAFPDRDEVLSSAARDHVAWIDQEVLPILKPLTTRPCVGVLAGHHFTQLSSNWNSVQYICASLSKKSAHPVPYLGIMSAWLRCIFEVEIGRGRRPVQRFVHVQHGVGGSQVAGGALKKLEKARAGFTADAYVRAHDCHLESAKVAVLRPREKGGHAQQIRSQVVPLLNIGSASKSYIETLGEPAYPEMDMMQPSAMGWGVLRAVPRVAWKFEDPSQNMMIDFRVEI